MTPFEPGGPDIPAAPFEVPQPDIPTADFVEIGKQVAKGATNFGLWNSFFETFRKFLAEAVGIVLAAIVGLIEWVIAKLLALLLRAIVSNEAGTNEIASLVVGAMTGHNYAASAFSNATDSSGRDVVGKDLINDIQAAMAKGVAASSDTGISASKAGADAFLQITSHIAVEGWLIGWLADAFTVHELEKLGDLKDGLERALGLGRLARRALSAPMKILVEDPYTYLLNSQYRPTLPSTELLVRQYIRGIIDRPRLDKLMGYHGYANDGVEALINFNRAHLSAAQIVDLLLHGQIEGDTATKLLAAQGYDDATQTLLVVAEENSRLDTWDKQLLAEMFTALRDRQISEAEVQDAIDRTHLPAIEKAKLTQILHIRAGLTRKRFTLSEAETLVKKGIWSLDKFRELATQLGYTSEDETDLELLTLLAVKDAADAAAKRQTIADQKAKAAKAKAEALAAKAKAAAAAAEAKGVSVARFETLVTDGLKTIAEYRQFLTGKGIAADNITALVSELQGKLDKTAAAEAARPTLAAGAKARNVDLGQLEAAVKAGAIPLPAFTARLTQIGFTEEDAQLLTDVLANQLQAADTKAAAKADAAAKAKARKVDLAQLNRGVRIGLVTVQEYAARLDELGFSPADRDLLVAEIEKQLESDQAAAALKSSVAGALKTKGLNLAQLEAAVRAGLNTVEDYRAALAKQGYDAAAQDSLVSLLKLRMEQDAETAATKGRAAAELGKAGLSLVDIERAVKLGVVPITVYSDALKASGLAAADQQVLLASLAAQLKTTRTARAVVAQVSEQLKLVGLGLAKLEQDVLDGRLNIEQFKGLLQGANVAAADVDTIVGLVREELANAEHVAQLEGQVSSTAAAKGLNLAQEKAAVLAGVKTLADYQAFVEGLGYRSADVQTLVGTLAEKLRIVQAQAHP